MVSTSAPDEDTSYGGGSNRRHKSLSPRRSPRAGLNRRGRVLKSPSPQRSPRNLWEVPVPEWPAWDAEKPAWDFSMQSGNVSSVPDLNDAQLFKKASATGQALALEQDHCTNEFMRDPTPPVRFSPFRTKLEHCERKNALHSPSSNIAVQYATGRHAGAISTPAEQNSPQAFSESCLCSGSFLALPTDEHATGFFDDASSAERESPTLKSPTSATQASPKCCADVAVGDTHNSRERSQFPELNDLEAKFLNLQADLQAQQSRQQTHKYSLKEELEAKVKRQHLEDRRLECKRKLLEDKRKSLEEQHLKLYRREQALLKKESELVLRERSLNEQQAALAKEQSILDARSKNLGFNVNRQKNEVQRKKERMKKEAVQEAMHVVDAENRKLEQERQAARREKQEAVEVALGLKAPAPAHWKNQEMEATLDVRVTCKQDSQVILNLLQASALHPKCNGRDGVFEVGKIRKVDCWRIENPILWRQYISKGEELRSRHRVMGTSCEPVDPEVPEHMVPDMPSHLKWRSSGSFDASTNEVLLWHGTKSDIIDSIVKQGFDERVCSLSGMFGAGLYFAQDSCKSGQYALMDRKSQRWFLLCRVRLGRPFYPSETMRNERKAPDGFDSVVFNPEQLNRHIPMAHHRELIIYDRYQAYPEYVVCAAF